MGLTSWKNAPDGKIVKADVSVAKNYLSMDEMQELNEIVTMYLDYALSLIHISLRGHDGFDIIGLGQGAHIHIVIHHQELVFQVCKMCIRDR